ncbi:MAG TPA: TIR domain-containing protein [Candidatus Absconditabacterales bacterium]|nr:TIR domain-containing protein [Candidatus Absconditabacterales bacterium]HOQ78834.1 TIR domain-containing protein [Candidatus Absconditabacterales bacterium]HPK27822.1 TIR domain-containing protein [Candidatus Absconditabacterales bacterium]
MVYANKTYIAFDADNDIHYYRLMCARKHNDNTSFNFYDAHDLNNLRSYASEEQIKRKLSERMQNAKIFILLVGENTKNLFKFVRREIEQAIKKGLPIIVVNLNGKRSMDTNLCPAILKDELAIHISYNQKIIEYAMNNWINSFYELKQEGNTGPYYYKQNIYQNLGL